MAQPSETFTLRRGVVSLRRDEKEPGMFKALLTASSLAYKDMGQRSLSRTSPALAQSLRAP